MNLAEKTVLVTGAGGGIGRAIVRRLVAEGSQVIATDVNYKAATESVHGASAEKALPLQCNVSDPEDVQSAIAAGVHAFGKVDSLCNVAGGSSPRDGHVTEAEEAEFWRVMRVDLFGTFLVCKFGIPELIRSGGGSVVNFTSMGALIALADRDCYTAAKGGIAAMTRSMAVRYGEENVRVNAIAPGITRTDRIEQTLGDSKVKEFARRHVLGLLEPEDVANLTAFLISDDSSKITGQTMSVDSGVTIS